MSDVASATAGAEAAGALQQKTDAVMAYVMHHAANSHTLKLSGLPAIELPGFLTVHGVMVILAAVILIVLFGLVYRRKDAVPTGITNLLESFVVFVRDEISIKYLGARDGMKMTPLFCSLFFFILTMNLVGMIPGFAAGTSNLSVTAPLAIITLLFMTVGAIYKNGPVAFFKSFAPQGVPWPVLIIVAPMEFIGLFVRAFALTLRLFANMLAGHIAMMVMLGIVVMFGLWGLPVIALALFIYMLELFVAFLQAYVFTLLSALFIGQAYHPSH